MGFPGGSVVKYPPVNVGYKGVILIREDPSCHRATKPVHHNYWTWALEPRNCSYWALKPMCPRAWAQQQEKPLQGETHASTEEYSPLTATRESSCSSEDGAQPKVKKYVFFFCWKKRIQLTWKHCKSYDSPGEGTIHLYWLLCDCCVYLWEMYLKCQRWFFW